MEFKSFVKKALMTVLTLAVCIPVILKVASANASEGAYVDVEVQFLNAEGTPIEKASPGDTVIINVLTTMKYADGTPVEASKILNLEYQAGINYFNEHDIILTQDNSRVTVTVPDPAYRNPKFEMLITGAAIDTTVSADMPDFMLVEFRGDVTKELTVDPLTESDSSCDDSSSSDGGSSSSGDAGSSSGDSGSSESSDSSDSSSAAGGGAAAPAGNGGGAGGNAGATTVGGVYTATSMNSIAITSPMATVAAAAGLSDADIAAGTNVRTYICDSRNREVKDVLKAVAETSGRRIVAYIDVDLYTITKAGVVTNVRNTAEPVTMTFGLPGSLANAGHTYSIMCLNPDGTTAVFEDIDTNNATITINATTFGTYAIVINP